MTENFVRTKNRCIYSVSAKRYVSYEYIKELIAKGAEIRVWDGSIKQGSKTVTATTKDITNYILRQIIRYDETLDTAKMLKLLQTEGPLQ